MAPFGPAISERPPIPTEQERQQQLLQAQLEKDLRKAASGRSVSKQRIREIARDETRLQELPESLAAAIGEAGGPRPAERGEEQTQMPPINVRARQNVAAAAQYTEKGLENEKQLERVQKAAGSVAEDVARGGKAI